MRQRKKVQTEVSETLAREEAEDRDGADEADKEKKGFFACYLLVSLNPRHKSHTYIGFTVNPRRRIRQHNGEIGSGAWRTKKRRPWEMVFCIYGFRTNVSALQFEWAWQHPIESLAVRKVAIEFKSLSGIANKIKLAYTMLSLPSWQSLNLTVNYFSTKYVKHSAGCPSLPENIKVEVCAMDELPCYRKGDESLFENDDNWDKEFDEATFDDKFIEETISDPPTSNDSLDHENDISNDSNESCRWNEGKDCTEQSSFTDFQAESSANVGNSIVMEVERKGCTKQSSFADLSAMSSANVGKKFVIEVIDNGNLPLFNEDSSRPNSEHLATTVTDNKPCRRSRNMRNEIEVIDVTTPSPLCRASVRGKKKQRVSSGCPEIIDLTRSPSFVQL